MDDSKWKWFYKVMQNMQAMCSRCSDNCVPYVLKGSVCRSVIGCPCLLVNYFFPAKLRVKILCDDINQLQLPQKTTLADRNKIIKLGWWWWCWKPPVWCKQHNKFQEWAKVLFWMAIKCYRTRFCVGNPKIGSKMTPDQYLRRLPGPESEHDKVKLSKS